MVVLLDTILASPVRLESLDVGVSDLIACTADLLSGGEEIERENAGLMWRLIGASPSVGVGQIRGPRRSSGVIQEPLHPELQLHRFSIP